MIFTKPNLFNTQFNQHLDLALRRSADWRLCLDDRYLPGMDWTTNSDSGLVFYTYTDERDWNQLNSQDLVRAKFNYLAESILNTAIPLELGQVTGIRRIMWNYYNRSGNGLWHRDYQEPGVWSMVYNLTETDGGTEIEDNFYQGHAGTAVIFPSNLEHRGRGPQEEPYRFVLNVMFTAE